MNADENKIADKKAWTQPALTRLDAGSAETQSGANGDGGGGAQGS